MKRQGSENKMEEYYLLDVVSDNEDSTLKNKSTGEELVGSITIYGDYISFMTRFTLLDYIVMAIIPDGF